MSDDIQFTSLDWRHRVATTLAEDWHSPYTNQLHKRGTPVSVSTFIKFGEKEIQIGDPSAPALFLSLAIKSYNMALESNPFLVDWPPVDRRGPSPVAYDYLENIMASIVFSYSALEAFANEEIPDDFKYEEQKESGILVVRNKGWMEKNLSLDLKLNEILSLVKNKETPKGLYIWGDYVNLRRLRHRIIHLKSNDRVTSNDRNLYPASIWSQLFQPNQQNFPETAMNIIRYYKEGEHAYWIENSPI